MTQPKLTKWFQDRGPLRTVKRNLSPVTANAATTGRRSSPRFTLCLGGDGLALRSWAASGKYTCLSQTIRKAPLLTEEIVKKHAGSIAVALAFPPCVDLASAGARWWKKKRSVNPNFQADAVERLRKTERLLVASRAPYVMFTPASPLISKLFKKPRAIISPYQFGQYLQPDFAHPTHSEVIPARDAYHKKTFLYFGNGFVFPRRKPVAPEWTKIKSRKTGKIRLVSPVFAKRKNKVQRKLSPLGFCEAVYLLHGSKEHQNNA